MIRAVAAYESVQALVVRDVASRFGGDVLGYLWTYVLPLASIGFIYVAFAFLGRTLPFHTDSLSFILSGMLPYLLCRFTISAIVRARTAAAKLYILPSVTRNRAFIATAIVEFYNGLILYALLFTFNWLLFGNGELSDPLLALTGFATAWGLGGAFGYMMVSLSRFGELFIRAVPVILRPLFFVSGVFYTANELPAAILDMLRFNPLLHAIELIRSGLFLSYASRTASLLYPLGCIAAMLVVGWLVQRPLEGTEPAAAE